MIILSTSLVPPAWQIPGTSWAVILPLAYVTHSHFLFLFSLKCGLELIYLLSLQCRLVAGGHILFPVSTSTVFIASVGWPPLSFPDCFEPMVNDILILKVWTIRINHCRHRHHGHTPTSPPSFLLPFSPTFTKKKNTKNPLHSCWFYWTLSLRTVCFFYAPLFFFPTW